MKPNLKFYANYVFFKEKVTEHNENFKYILLNFNMAKEVFNRTVFIAGIETYLLKEALIII